MKRTSQSILRLCLWLSWAWPSAAARSPTTRKISSDIQGKFSQDSGLSTKQLTVQANQGVVTLGGTVDNEAQREAASRQAASVAGVKEVVNNLEWAARRLRLRLPPRHPSQPRTRPPAPPEGKQLRRCPQAKQENSTCF